MLQVLIFNMVQVSVSMYGRDMLEFITEQFPITQVELFVRQSPTLQGLLERDSVFPMISQLVLETMGVIYYHITGQILPIITASRLATHIFSIFTCKFHSILIKMYLKMSIKTPNNCYLINIEFQHVKVVSDKNSYFNENKRFTISVRNIYYGV